MPTAIFQIFDPANPQFSRALFIFLNGKTGALEKWKLHNLKRLQGKSLHVEVPATFRGVKPFILKNKLTLLAPGYNATLTLDGPIIGMHKGSSGDYIENSSSFLKAGCVDVQDDAAYEQAEREQKAHSF